MTDRGVDLSIVIPAFNEADRLPGTLRRLGAFLARRSRTWEVIVSDDGSTDATIERCRGCLPGREPRFIRVEENRGKGHAVKLGMMRAAGAIRIMYDADDSMPPEELPKLIAPIERHEARVAIGSRYLNGGGAEGQPLWRRGWSRLVNHVVRRTLVPDIRDTHCGYKAFTARAADEIFRRATVNGWSFDLEALALARRLGHPVIEVSVKWTNDPRSRVRPWRDLPRVIIETLRIRAACGARLSRERPTCRAEVPTATPPAALAPPEPRESKPLAS